MGPIGCIVGWFVRFSIDVLPTVRCVWSSDKVSFRMTQPGYKTPVADRIEVLQKNKSAINKLKRVLMHLCCGRERGEILKVLFAI